MDIYEQISKKIQSPQTLEISAGVSSIINHSESRKGENGHIYPLILIIRDGESILLEAHEAFVWRLIEKKKDFTEINISYFYRYKKLGTDFIHQVINNWYEKGILINKKDIYTLLKRNDLAKIIDNANSFFKYISTKVTLNIEYRNADSFYTFIYKFIKVFFTRFWLVLFSVLGILGFVLLLKNINLENIHITSNLLLINIAILFFNFVSIFLHESAHAIMAKHNGLKIQRVGFRIYLGYPVFYVDTTNAWSLERSKRLAISGAGVYVNFLLIGLLSLLLPLIGNSIAILIIGQIIYVNLVELAVNFIPFVEFDGYYILIDILKEPELRQRSLNLLVNFVAGKKNTGQEIYRTLLIFGILSFISTTLLFSLGIWLLGNDIIRLLGL